MKRRIAILVGCLLIGSILALPRYGTAREAAEPARGEEFFIISSVDAKKQQILLKRPTEVTQLVRVTDKTAFRDEDGKPLQLKDFRAGDTVYVLLTSSREGTPAALRIRKGIMTPEELHRRYLKFE